MEVLSYRNQSIDLQSKPTKWFLHDRDFRHERISQIYSHCSTGLFKIFSNNYGLGGHRKYQHFLEQSKMSKSVTKYYAQKKKKLKLPLSFLFNHLYGNQSTINFLETVVI